MYILFLLKHYIHLEYMEELTASEKGDIFENVNSMYLHMTGNKKTQTKRSFKTSWNKDNMCYILMIALDNAYDKWSKAEDQEDHKFMIQTMGNETVTLKKHTRTMNMMKEEMLSLETAISDIEEGKGYISEESHRDFIEALKNDKEEVIRDQGNTIGKLRNENEMLREKYEMSERRFEASKKYYEDTISKVCAMD